MSAVAEPSGRVALSGGVRMALITPRAEKQFLALSPPERRRVARVLSRPVPGPRYRKLVGHDNPALYHFDLSKGMRATAREVGGRACVIHIGPHDEFEKSAAAYTGTLPAALIPLEESRLMKQPQRNTSANGAATTKAVVPPPAPAVPADIIAQAMTGFFAQAFAAEKERLADEVLTFSEFVTVAQAEARAAAQALAKRLDDHAEELVRVRDAIETRSDAALSGQAARLDRLEAAAHANDRLAAGVQALAAERAALADDLGRLEIEHQARTSGLAASQRDVEGRLDEVAERLARGAASGDELGAELRGVEGRTRTLEERTADLQSASAEAATAASDRANGLEQRLGGVEAGLAATRTSVESLANALRDLTASVAELGHGLAELRTARERRTLRPRLLRVLRLLGVAR